MNPNSKCIVGPPLGAADFCYSKDRKLYKISHTLQNKCTQKSHFPLKSILWYEDCKIFFNAWNVQFWTYKKALYVMYCMSLLAYIYVRLTFTLDAPGLNRIYCTLVAILEIITCPSLLIQGLKKRLKFFG